MTDIQAALGLNQLKKVDQMITKRREIARLYDEVFGNMNSRRDSKDRIMIQIAPGISISFFHEKGERDRT